MATYAIGDIQGCYDEFISLLELINFSDDDQLWLAGDLINRGPKSLQTLRHIHEIRHQTRIVLGNHDLHLLAVSCNGEEPNRKDTLDDILYAEDRQPLLDWLRSQPLLHYDADLGYAMVHAGIPPIWTLQQALDYAAEVHTALTSDHYWDYFSGMYGNQPDIWNDELQGIARLRCITNYFTRMRFCTAEGRLDFNNKSATPPPGFAPWFSHPQRKAREIPIIFGHWASLEGEAEADHVFALDTGCVWGGSLTAMRLEDRRFFSVSSRRHA